MLAGGSVLLRRTELSVVSLDDLLHRCLSLPDTSALSLTGGNAGCTRVVVATACLLARCMLPRDTAKLNAVQSSDRVKNMYRCDALLDLTEPARPVLSVPLLTHDAIVAAAMASSHSKPRRCKPMCNLHSTLHAAVHMQHDARTSQTLCMSPCSGVQ